MNEEIRESISRARQAQQENEQKHDVQLEISNGPMGNCSPIDNPEWTWANEHERFWLRSSVWFDEPRFVPVEDPYPEWPIYGPGPDCEPED